jgi:aminopeptidase-like protein
VSGETHVPSDQSLGQAMHRLVTELYPICRSITGNGLRETLRIVSRTIPLQLHEVPSGTRVLDWTVPKEWNIRDAWVKNSRGERVVDFQEHNLHVMNYSVPVRAKMSLRELRPHLYSLPERPDWIPYRTSYYKEDWAFGLSHKQLLALAEDSYDVCIDSSLADGSLTYGECLLVGESTDEVLISTHACHPSLANDNLSGIAVAVFLAQALSQLPRRYSYRFLFIPATIGSIAWLALNPDAATRVKHGLVLAGVGDAGHTTYKKSRRGDAEIDRAVELVLKHSGAPYAIEEFSPYGYDERQYCSPGFNLAVGCLSRTPYSRYPQYHTSADNLELVRADALADTYSKCVQIFEVLEHNRRYINLNPKGEPQLGKRGLYDSVGGRSDAKSFQVAMLWLLNLSDGTPDLLDIALRAGLPFGVIRDAADALVSAGLLRETDATEAHRIPPIATQWFS